MPSRISWIDNVKALAIFFVVLGHTIGLPPAAEKLIFSFHMPIFFFLSGMLAKAKTFSPPASAFFTNRLRKRLTPYLFFAAVSYVAWLALFRHFGAQAAKDISPWRALAGIFYGLGIDDWLTINITLWFFLGLLITECLFFPLARQAHRGRCILFLVGCSIVGYIDTWIFGAGGLKLPWEIDIALTTVVFYGAGYLCRPLIDQITQRRGRLILALLPVGAIYVGCSLINTKVAVVAGVYGNYALFYLAAFSGIAFWMLIAMLVPGNRLMQRIGASTLVIFPMHLLVFPFITAVLIYVLKWPPDIRYHSIALSLCYALISIGVLIPISDLMMRHAPVLLGLPPSKPKD